MNKKQQAKLEDIENEIDMTKKVTVKKLKSADTYTIKKATSNGLNSIPGDKWQAYWDAVPDAEIEIPHLRGGDWEWNFEKQSMHLTNKITWVLTVVNIAILISLVIKHV